MLNGSRTNRSGFHALPRRGAVALVTTVLAVALLFSFRPADPTAGLSAGLPGTLPTAAPEIGAPGHPTQQPTPKPVAAGPPAPTQRTSTGSGGTGSHPATAAPQATPGPVANTASGTYTGRAIQTPYGTVQIALVVENGTIVDVQELQLPSDRQLSREINAQAGPMLREQVLQAQSANINGVSGASYTSEGFYQSLQSALQQM